MDNDEELDLSLTIEGLSVGHDSLYVYMRTVTVGRSEGYRLRRYSLNVSSVLAEGWLLSFILSLEPEQLELVLSPAGILVALLHFSDGARIYFLDAHTLTELTEIVYDNDEGDQCSPSTMCAAASDELYIHVHNWEQQQDIDELESSMYLSTARQDTRSIRT